MSKVLSFILLAVASCAAQTVTPNIGLQVPAYNQTNWQVPITYDLNKIDLLLSGNALAPSINVGSVKCNGSLGTSGQILSTTGSACQWINGGSFSGYPGVTTYDANGLSIAGGVVAGSTMQSVGYLSLGGTVFAQTASTANSGTNFPSPNVGQEGSFWSGSQPFYDTWFWTVVLGTGANPAATYTLSHVGTSGALAVSLPAPVTATSYAAANGVLLPSTANPPTGNASGNVELTLAGTTGTITGTVLTASCDSGTATVTGAVVGRPVAVSSTTGVDVGGAFNLRASVTATNTVTVYVCGTGTPSSLAYNVTVL
jgi:hypothetical protein